MIYQEGHVFDNENNFDLNNILMGFRRKIERSKIIMDFSDVYGTYVLNNGVTTSIRKVSAYSRDKNCGLFDNLVLKVDCPQYAADAESTGVK